MYLYSSSYRVLASGWRFSHKQVYHRWTPLCCLVPVGLEGILWRLCTQTRIWTPHHPTPSHSFICSFFRNVGLRITWSIIGRQRSWKMESLFPKSGKTFLSVTLSAWKTFNSFPLIWFFSVAQNRMPCATLRLPIWTGMSVAIWYFSAIAHPPSCN